MKMIITPTSPYARKARALIIAKQLTCEMMNGAPWDDDPQILTLNPLRKVPVLLTDDGAAIVDSRVICEYLDALSDSPRFLPAAAAARWATKSREALIEGAMDSALMLLMSGRAAADMTPSASWRQWLMSKAQRTLDVLEQDIHQRGEPDMSDIACFCFLDFWLFRMPQTQWEDWRPSRPQLAAWFERLSDRACFVQTDPRQT